jgi:ATP-dependent Clp protease ATP-binding subunit ClpX
VRVLTEPKDCLVEQIKVLFSLDNIELEFTIESINRIADIAITQNLGARGLRKILDDCLMETQYDLPDLKKRGYKKATITPEVIDKMRKPHMQKGSSVE